jgi:hypothetical protein
VSISAVSRKMLWGRAGNECAYPGCTARLLQDLEDAETGILRSRGAVIGEEAHIRGEKLDSARYDAAYLAVDEYPNRILLCPTHHTIIDKKGGAAWPPESLERIKAEHEAAKDALRDVAQQRKVELEERLAASVEYWETGLLDQWQRFTANLFQPHPKFRVSDLRVLMDKGAWLLAKDWPSDYPRMTAAFERWGFAVSQLCSWVNETFDAASEKETDWLELVRGHKRLVRIDRKAYDELLAQSLRESVVTWALIVDLTRATNLVIRAIRDDLDSLYRFHEGVVLFRIPDMIHGDQVRRVEFETVDWPTIGRGGLDRRQVNALVKSEYAARRLDRYDDLDPFTLTFEEPVPVDK